jgi:threonine/homoserine/homoserine lactone efflux protein
MAVTPGPANIFAVATGMEKGKAAALTAVLGMNSATLVWFGAAALGLGALVIAFPQVFRVIAVLGALYVAWLGIKALRGAFATAAEPAHIEVKRGRSALIDGFMVQIANPKAILFFTAVLPPFLDINRPLAPQLALFAVTTVGMDGLSMCGYGLGGAALARQMTAPRFRKGFGIVVGCLLLLAAVLIVSRL